MTEAVWTLHGLPVALGRWDLVLVAGVSLQATALAYLYHPRWKALVLTLPVPFTCATLAVGRPVDATNLLGLPLLFLYAHGVRWLHYTVRVPIVPAIAVSALGYVAAGWALAPHVPASGAAFWMTGAGTLAAGAILLRMSPPRAEPGHRSPLPLWIKLPVIVAVVGCLVVLKQGLQGFTTLFPMVGVVAAYEARHSLWTVCRQMPVVMLTLTPLMMTVRLAQGRLGLGLALLLGWAVFLAAVAPFARDTWRAASASAE